MKDILEKALAKLLQLFSDSKTGQLSPSKSGVVIAGATFTLKMVGLLPDSSPDDPLLWLTFMGLVGSIDVAKKAINVIWGPKNDAPADPGA